MKFHYLAILLTIYFIEVTNSQLHTMDDENVLFKRAKVAAMELKDIYYKIKDETRVRFNQEAERILDETKAAGKTQLLETQLLADQKVRSVNDKAMKSLYKGVDNAGVNECLRKIDNVTNISLEGFMQECSTRELRKAIRLVRIYSLGYSSMESENDDPRSLVEFCKSRRSPSECVSNIIGVISFYKSDFPAQMRKMTENRLDEIRLHIDEAMICLETDIADFKTYIDNVVGEANSCLEKKMKIVN